LFQALKLRRERQNREKRERSAATSVLERGSAVVMPGYAVPPAAVSTEISTSRASAARLRGSSPLGHAREPMRPS